MKLPPKPSIDGLELERDALLRRVGNLPDGVKQHPGYKTALKLLNQKFRTSKIKARITVLQAAAFMIEVLERLPL